jgi:hypothetical protein
VTAVALHLHCPDRPGRAELVGDADRVTDEEAEYAPARLEAGSTLGTVSPLVDSASKG